MNYFRAMALLFSGPVVSLRLVACSDDDNEDGGATTGDVSTAVGEAGGAEGELCQSLEDLGDAVEDVQNFSSSSTFDEAEQARNDLQNALDNATEEAGQTAQAEFNVLQTAFDAFNTAVDSLPGNATLGEAASALSNFGRGLADAFDTAETEARCQ
jgi:ElaB/YqjD/DUF883 family membrane-anchored ribosome-binding protein